VIAFAIVALHQPLVSQAAMIAGGELPKLFSLAYRPDVCFSFGGDR
jgi:hypothetical protein